MRRHSNKDGGRSLKTKGILFKKKLIFIEFSSFGRAHPSMETGHVRFLRKYLPTLYFPSHYRERVSDYGTVFTLACLLFNILDMRFHEKPNFFFVFFSSSFRVQEWKNSPESWKQKIKLVAHQIIQTINRDWIRFVGIWGLLGW